MGSVSMAFAASAAVSGKVFQATATAKSTGGSAEEKGLFDWILGGLRKEDQLVETDPILKKVDEKNYGSGTGTTRRKSPNSISVPGSKKSNGSGGVFGGLFAKK
ncbi:hypothetical protein KFK09_021675 [Dendrobium nobile]|uniref:Thylakoid soluble phosphoprotein TSP9 n=1 Tax=Dendrobium nobile TaxID=94219 RepID=A0A8T3APW0_DENNO|nr:hypothetical protein KFK09_021675 [Dendrobium nobile]